MIEITSPRRTITRTAHQAASSRALTVGELKPGVIFSASRQLAARHVVFQQRIAAGNRHPFQPPHDAIGQLRMCGWSDSESARFDSGRFRRESAADWRPACCRSRPGRRSRRPRPARSSPRPSPRAAPCAPSYDALRDIPAWCCGKLVAIAAAGQVGAAFGRRLSSGTQIASRHWPTSSGSRSISVGADLGHQVAAGDAHVDRPFGAQHGNVFGAQKRDVDRHVAAAGEQAAILPAKIEPRFFQQLAGQLRPGVPCWERRCANWSWFQPDCSLGGRAAFSSSPEMPKRRASSASTSASGISSEA